MHWDANSRSDSLIARDIVDSLSEYLYVTITERKGEREMEIEREKEEERQREGREKERGQFVRKCTTLTSYRERLP